MHQSIKKVHLMPLQIIWSQHTKLIILYHSHHALIRCKTSLIERRGVMNHHLEVAVQIICLPPFSRKL